MDQNERYAILLDRRKRGIETQAVGEHPRTKSLDTSQQRLTPKQKLEMAVSLLLLLFLILFVVAAFCGYINPY